MNERLIQFQCDREGTQFYYQTSLLNPHFINHCPLCGSKRISKTGREFPAVDKNRPLEAPCST